MARNVDATTFDGTGLGPPATINIGGNLVVETVTGFSEAFGSTDVEQIQCKHGAWKSFGTLFTSQGYCVSFLASHGKNSPAWS